MNSEHGDRVAEKRKWNFGLPIGKQNAREEQTKTNLTGTQREIAHVDDCLQLTGRSMSLEKSNRGFQGRETTVNVHRTLWELGLPQDVLGHIEEWNGQPIVVSIREWCASQCSVGKSSIAKNISVLDELTRDNGNSTMLGLLEGLVLQSRINATVEGFPGNTHEIELDVPRTSTKARFFCLHHRNDWIVTVRFQHHGTYVPNKFKGYEGDRYYFIPSLELAWHLVFNARANGCLSSKMQYEYFMNNFYGLRRHLVFAVNACVKANTSRSVESATKTEQASNSGIHPVIDEDSLVRAVERGRGSVDAVVREVKELLCKNGVYVTLGTWKELDDMTQLLEMEIIPPDAEVGAGPHSANELESFIEDPRQDVMEIHGKHCNIGLQTEDHNDGIDHNFWERLGNYGVGDLKDFFQEVLGITGSRRLLMDENGHCHTEQVTREIFKGLRVMNKGRRNIRSLQPVSLLKRMALEEQDEKTRRHDTCVEFGRVLLLEGNRLETCQARRRFMSMSFWRNRNKPVWFTNEADLETEAGFQDACRMALTCGLEIVRVSNEGGMGVPNCIALLILLLEDREPPSDWLILTVLVLVGLSLLGTTRGGVPCVLCDGDGKLGGGPLHDSHDTGQQYIQSIIHSELQTENSIIQRGGQEGRGVTQVLDRDIQKLAIGWAMDVVREPPMGRSSRLTIMYPYYALHCMPFVLGRPLIVLRSDGTRQQCAGNKVSQNKGSTTASVPNNLWTWDVFKIGPFGERVVGACGSYAAALRLAGHEAPLMLYQETGRHGGRYFALLPEAIARLYR